MFLSRMVYYSRAVALGAADLEKIAVTSQANNYIDNITGALFFNGSWFIQVLEGGRKEVSRLFRGIYVDPRHSDVTLVDFRRVDERLFSDWGMRYVGSDSAQERIIRRYMAGAFDPSLIPDGDVFVRLLRELADATPPIGPQPG